MAVRPAQEDAPLAEDLDVREALRVRRERCIPGPARALLARARAAERAEGQDAVVPVAPDHAERVPSDLRQLLDVGRVAGHGRGR